MMNHRKVTVVDFGMGNLLSIERAIRHVGGNVNITYDYSKIASADRLVLPGVGAFGNAMLRLKETGIEDAVKEFAQTCRPLLGICLGMQLLLSESYEFGHHIGLALIDGKVVRFKDTEPKGPHFKIPQIGWAEIEFPTSGTKSTNKTWDNTILAGIQPGRFFYFVHSYICVPESDTNVLAESVYGEDRFCSVAYKDNIYGCQFHPEKSDTVGLNIYHNLLRI